MARPTKLTPERAERILQLAAGGEYLVTICADVGIDPSTLDNWRARGRAATLELEDGPMADSYEARQELDGRKARGLRPTQRLEKAAHRYDTWHERPFFEFLRALQRAEAVPERDAVLRVRDIGRGGQLLHRRETTTRRPNGTVTTVVDETFSAPQWAALMTFLERRYAARWRRQVELLPGQQQEEDDPLRAWVADLGSMREERRAALRALPGGRQDDGKEA